MGTQSYIMVRNFGEKTKTSILAYPNHVLLKFPNEPESKMAIGQKRSLAEGVASVKAKISENPFQFFLATVLVMACGATKKVPALAFLSAHA